MHIYSLADKAMSQNRNIMFGTSHWQKQSILGMELPKKDVEEALTADSLSCATWNHPSALLNRSSRTADVCMSCQSQGPLLQN